MDELRCADVQSWMREIVQPGKLIPPTPALVAHVAGCPLCRGAFALLAAKAVDLPSLAGPITCRHCEEDLAAFIEQEAEETSAAAIRTCNAPRPFAGEAAVCPGIRGSRRQQPRQRRGRCAGGRHIAH